MPRTAGWRTTDIIAPWIGFKMRTMLRTYSQMAFMYLDECYIFKSIGAFRIVG